MIEISNLSKLYQTKKGLVRALDKVTLSVDEGEFLVLRGHSGSGKTTLLLTLGGMLHPSEGSFKFLDKEVYGLNEGQRNRFRADNIGFVFQMFHLVPYLTVQENVLLSHGGKTSDRSKRAQEILEELHMDHRTHHKPAELSAGEKQRAALARALINEPKLLLADEPTGNLDPKNAEEVVDHMSAFHKRGGTVVVVTHGSLADNKADRIISMKDGRIENGTAVKD
ncbi:MAG: ABC transporter ATP-binding protein [Candidatus Omnitrophica bacterium]|nr:ABC transporter ATP-binding protein [Candidatus Omnitrophota bacterium]